MFFIFCIGAGHITDMSKVSKFGLYNPWLFLGTALTAISGGIFATFKTDTGNGMIDGILVLSGLGFALVTQMVCLPIYSIVDRS